MLETYTGSVDVIDGLVDGFDKARVVVTGVSPNAVATLTVWDPMERRPHRVDRLTRCKVETGEDGAIHISGVSDLYVFELNLPEDEAVLTWVVHPGGCKECN